MISEARDGRVVWPLRAPHVLMSFFTLLANAGDPFPVTKGTAIDQSSARDVIAAMKTLSNLVDPACFDMDPIAALDALSESRKLGLCPYVYLYAPYARDRYRANRIAFHDMPSLGDLGPLGSALGGTGIAVSSKTVEPDLCVEYALWVASADIQRGLYATHNGQPGNALAWADETVNAPVGSCYSNTRMTHEAAWVRPRHDGYMAFQEEASHILIDALTAKTSPENALLALQTRFDESFDND